MANPTDDAAARLPIEFFQRGAVRVARDLIGATIVRRAGARILRARIVETEAYVGQHDLASHSARGRTPRTKIMFGPGGHAYVYFIYGMHEMFNVVCSVEGDAQAVLIRAAAPLDDWNINLSGPGRFARGMEITRNDNGADLTADALHFTHRPGKRPRIVTGPRIGVDYSGAWKDKPLRFCEAGNPAVSKPWPTPPARRPAR